MRNRMTAALAVLALLPSSAWAHVVLADSTARAGGEMAASFRVTHGCGASPTVALTIELPPGVTAHPQPKAGWTLEKAPDRITWRGGSLAADEFDEFALLLRLPKIPGALVFPATQTCAAGVEHWNEKPAPGQKSTHPAPVLTVLPGSSSQDMPGMAMP